MIDRCVFRSQTSFFVHLLFNKCNYSKQAFAVLIFESAQHYLYLAGLLRPTRCLVCIAETSGITCLQMAAPGAKTPRDMSDVQERLLSSRQVYMSKLYSCCTLKDSR